LVRGRLLGGKAEVAGNTSQYLSALLLSLPLAPKNSEIRVKNLRERPYVNMTLKWLKDLNIKYSVKRIKNVDIYTIKGGQNYKPFKKVIPGDFSSASCMLAAACLIPGTVVLKGLDVNDAQGDKKLLEILKKMGAELKISKNQILVKGGHKLKSLDINASDIPDLLPALAVIGTKAEGKTKIYNVPQARIKETDRIKSMLEGLRRMKAKTIEHKDGLTIYSGKLNGEVVKGFKDHRTVMAMSVAAMLAEGRTVITNAESINKTFPQFYAILKTLGADIKLTI
ncbi:MAG: 3-phosphoshikimate 1-carboxyvinyltransferase, partial [Patescibacteria group bacterium]